MFDDTLALSTQDTTLARTHHQIAAFSIQSDAADSVNLLRLTVNKTPGNTLIDSIFVQLDNNKNGGYNSGADGLAFTLTGSDTGGHTTVFSASPAYSLGGADSFVLTAYFRTALRNNDTVQFYFENEALANFSIIKYRPFAANQSVPKAATGNCSWPVFHARIDSTVVTSTVIGDTVIHPDSRVGQNPFTIFSGRIQGETRGLMTDRLRQIGVAFGGTAADSVASAWALLGGRATDTIVFTRHSTGTSWSASVDSTLTVSASETFLVRIMLSETTGLGSTVWAYVPKDSIVTEIRPSGPAANTDSSGVFTCSKPIVTISHYLVPITDTYIHPDSRARQADSKIVLTGHFSLGNRLTHDTISSIAVTFEGTAKTFVHTPEIKIGNSGAWVPMTQSVVQDTWTANPAAHISTSDSAFWVRVRMPETTTIASTLYAFIGIRECTTQFEVTGPSTRSESSGLFTCTKPVTGLTIYHLPLTDSIVHPDYRARTTDSVTTLSGYINFTHMYGLTYDTIVQFTVATAGIAKDTLATGEIRFGNSGTWHPMTRIGTDTWTTSTCTATVSTSDSRFVFRVRVPDTAQLGTIFSAFLGTHSCTTVFSMPAPAAQTDSSMQFTINKPPVNTVIYYLPLTDSIVHPDSRARTSDSVTVLKGYFGIATSISHDTIIQFAVRLLGTAWDTVAKTEVKIGNSGAWHPMTRQANGETWISTVCTSTITASDSLFQVRTVIPETSHVTSTLYASLGIHYCTSVFSLPTPTTATDSSLYITISRPQLGATAYLLPLADSVVHPDSRLRTTPLDTTIIAFSGHFNLASTITHDTVFQFAISFIGTIGDTIFTPELRIANSNWFPLTRVALDTWVTTTCTTTINGTTDSRFQIRLGIPDSAANSTLMAYVGVRACTSIFSLSGPTAQTDSSLRYTINKPVLGVDSQFIHNRVFHPNPQVTQDSVLVLAGKFNLVSPLTYDTITQITVVFGGTSRDSIVGVQIMTGDSRSPKWVNATREGTTDSWRANIDTTIRNHDTYGVRIYVSPSVNNGGTVYAHLALKSCSSAFSYPTPVTAQESSGIFTCSTTLLAITRHILGSGDSIIVHPDSRVRGIDTVVVFSGHFTLGTGHTYDTLAYDTVSSISVVFGGTGRLAIHNPLIKIGTGGWTALTQTASQETWTATPAGNNGHINRTTDSAFLVSVRLSETMTVPVTLTAHIADRHCTTSYHVISPSVPTDSSQVFNIRKPQMNITRYVLPATDSVVHVDSRVRGIDSVTLLHGFFQFTNLDSVTYDSVLQFAVTYGGTARTEVYAPEVRFGSAGTWHQMSRIAAGADTWISTTCTATISSLSSAESHFTVRAIIRDTTTPGGTIYAFLSPISCTTQFTLSSPTTTIDSSMLITCTKPFLTLTRYILGSGDSVIVHPDSRVRGVDTVTVLRGFFTMGGHTGSYDTVTSMSVVFGGTGRLAVHNPLIKIGTGAWTTLSQTASQETWTANFAGTSGHINRTTDTQFEVSVRLSETMTVPVTLTAHIAERNCTTAFHVASPSVPTDSSQVFYVRKPPLTLATYVLPDSRVHVDSRVRGIDSVTILNGYFRFINTDSVHYDTVVQLAVTLAGTARNEVYAPEIKIGSAGQWIQLSRVAAGADTWSTTACTHTIASTDSQFQVRAIVRESTTLGSTLWAYIGQAGCTSVFTVGSPLAGQTDSSAVLSCTKPILRCTAVWMGNDTILPALAYLQPFVIYTGQVRLDTTIVTADRDTLTGIQVNFDGSAVDSVYNASVSVGITGAWTRLNELTDSRWYIDTLAIQVRSYETVAIRINVADTVASSRTISCSVVIHGCSSIFHTAGPGTGTVTESSGVWTTYADPIEIGMQTLGDTSIPQWLKLGSNPVLVCSGFIYTNHGPVLGLTYDTLLTFGIGFETMTQQLRANDSVVSAVLVLDSTPVRLHAETIALTADTASSPRIYWKKTAGANDTTIYETQPFRVYVTLATQDTLFMRRLVNESFAVIVPRDSVSTRFTSASLHGDTWGSRNVTFVFPDTSYLRQDTQYTDTTVNPDSGANQNPVIVFGGSIHGVRGNAKTTGAGQQYYAPATDSIIYFAVSLLSTATSDVTVVDSIVSVTVYTTAETIYLQPSASYSDLLGNRIRKFSADTLNVLMRAGNNSETFIIKALAYETIGLSANSRVRAFMHSDSIITYYMAESRPVSTEILLGSRIVTYSKNSYSISPQQLTDSSISPFWQQMDSTFIFKGHFASTQAPIDSVATFGLRLLGSTGFRGESVSVTFALESGAQSLAPARSVSLRLNTPDTYLPIFALDSASAFTIETGQPFTIYVAPKDTLTINGALSLLGTSFSARLESSAARFSVGTLSNLSCSRTVYYNYTDTLRITNSLLADTAIHPDSRLNQNPVVAWIGTITGQSSKLNLGDTLQRFGVHFTGTAIDSVAAVTVTIDTHTALSLVQRDSASWSLPLDSGIPYNHSMQCTVSVRVLESVAVGATLRATIRTDSASSFFTADTGLFTASRTITYLRSTLSVHIESLGDTSIPPWHALGSNPIAVCSGTLFFADSTLSVVGYDTLTKFGIRFDTASAALLAQDTFAVVNLYLRPTSVRPAGDTISLAKDSTTPTRLWRLPVNADTIVSETQPFIVYVSLGSATSDTRFMRNFVGSTFGVVIPRDSILTSFSTGTLTTETSSQRTVTIAYPDSARAVLASLGNITIHPVVSLGQNPFTLMNGTIHGQIWKTSAGDSLTVFRVTLGGTARDSVLSVSLVMGSDSKTFSLSTADSTIWGATLDTTLRAVNNTESFRVQVTVNESVVVGNTLTASIVANQLATTYLGETGSTVTSDRTVTFSRPAISLWMQPLGDTVIPPWQALGGNPVVVCSGTIYRTSNPVATPTYDTLTRFGLSFDTVTATLLAQDTFARVQLYLMRSSHIAAGETINLVAGGATPTRLYRLAGGSETTISESQPFIVYVTLGATNADTSYMRRFNGETFFVRIPKDSVTTYFSVGTAGETSSGRAVSLSFPDSTRATLDSIAGITVHPDTDMNQNPFVIMTGTIRGQLYKVSAGDSLTNIAITFGGTAPDSVIAARVLLGADSRSINLTRNGGTYSWQATAIDQLLKGTNNTDTFIVYALVSESVVLGSTLTATIGPDTFTTTYLDDTGSAVTSTRTVLLNVPVANVTMDAIASNTIHPVWTQRQIPVQMMSGTIQGESTIVSDKLSRFQVNFVGQAKDSVLAVRLIVGASESTFVLNRSAAATIDTWGIDTTLYPFSTPDTSADTFRLLVVVDTNVNRGATLYTYFPVHGLLTIYRPAGPGTNATSGCTMTFLRGTMNVLTLSRNSAFPSAIQVNDTKEVMWFRAQISDTVEIDTLHILSVVLSGPDSTKFGRVFLARDLNFNQKYDTSPLDQYLGEFSCSSQVGINSTWNLNLATTTSTPTDTSGQDTWAMGATRETPVYLIVVRITDTSARSVRAWVPAGGADGPFSDTGPSAAVAYDSYNVVVPDSNPPLPPFEFNLAVEAGNFVITFGPSPSGDTQMTSGQYNLYWDSGLASQNNYAFLYQPDTVLQAIPHVSGQLSYSVTLSNLVEGREYRFRLRSQDQAGNQGDATAIMSAVFRAIGSPQAPASATLVEPAPGDHVYYDSTVGANKFQLVAQVTFGTATGVTFYMRPITGGNWWLLGAATDSSYDGTGQVFYSLMYESSNIRPDSSYEIRAVASTSAGVDTYAIGYSITATSDTARSSSVAIVGTASAYDTTYHERVLSTRSEDDFMIVRTPAGAFDIVVRFKRGALSRDTDRLYALAMRDTYTDTVLSAVKAAGALVPRYWINMLLQSGQTTLNGAGATITVNYIDLNGDGFEDSTGIDMSKAKIFTINSGGKMEMLNNPTFDKERRTLTATITHFSPFFVTNDTGTSASGLNQLIVGPNPFRPNDGNDATGKPWVAGDATSGIMFKNLPPNSRIEIYTILGEKVAEFTNGGAGATISWSVKNNDGRDVASGYYLYMVTDPATGQRVTGKVAVVR